MDLQGGEYTHREDSVDRELLWELEWNSCHSTNPVQIRNLFKQIKSGERMFVSLALMIFFLTGIVIEVRGSKPEGGRIRHTSKAEQGKCKNLNVMHMKKK